MLSNSLEDLQVGFMRVKNKEPEVDIYNKYLAAFSESINGSRLPEEYANVKRIIITKYKTMARVRSPRLGRWREKQRLLRYNQERRSSRTRE
jgi:hypothetical protein